MMCRAAVLVVLGSTPLLGQIQLVKDINSTPNTTPRSSWPRELVVAGGAVFFTADSARFGREVHRTQGTAGTTQLVHDARPGRQGSEPEGLVALGNSIYFSADDGVSGRELWTASIGSARRVIDLLPGAVGSDPQDLVALGNRILFTAVDGSGARQLYRSDGTSGGTVRFHGADARGLHVAGRFAWFTTSSQTEGRVWRTDGTTAGTVSVLRSGRGDLMRQVHAFNGGYAFGYYEGCKTDLYTLGAAAGRAVRVGLLASHCSGVHLLGVHHGLLWLSVPSYQTYERRDLWKSDGTIAGTVPVRPASSVPDWPKQLVGLGANVYYVNDRGELWRSDGTAAGTSKMAIPPLDPQRAAVAAVGGRLWFAAQGAGGVEPWVSDGTVAGSRRVADLNPGPSSSRPSQFTPVSGGVVFSAAHDAYGEEIWSSDGTAVGTRLLRDILPSSGTLGGAFGILGHARGRLVLSATDGVRGNEVWVSDGTAGGTNLLVDWTAGNNRSGGPFNGITVEDRVFFNYSDANTSVSQLCVTDGTPAGTRRLTNDRFGVGRNHCASGSRLFYTRLSDFSVDLMRLNLVTGVTRELARFRLGTSGRPREWDMHMTAVDTDVFFFGYSAQDGYEPWKTDGTPSGTKQIQNTYQGTAGQLPGVAIAWRGRWYFNGYRQDGRGGNLWVTDGTGVGTRRLSRSFGPLGFAATADKLFFTAGGLFVTDGTALGTTQVAPAVSQVRDLVVLADRVLFGARGQGFDYQLWVSNGTTPGTYSLGGGESVRELVGIGKRRVIFKSSTRNTGTEFFITDGTRPGTRMIANLNPGSHPGTSAVGGVVLAGGTVYMLGDDGSTGSELYRYDPGGTRQFVGDPCGPSQTILKGSDPEYGNRVRLVGENVPTSGTGLLAVGLGPSVRLQHCLSYISQPVVFVPVSGPRWVLDVPLASDPRTLGLQAIAQGLYLNPSAPNGFELSNATVLTIGR